MLEATLLAIRPPVHPVFVEIFTGISVTDYITPVSGVGSHPDRLAVETQPTEGQTMLKTLSAAVGVLFVDKSCKPSIFFMLFSFLCFNQIRDMESNKAFPFEILLRKKIMEDTSRNPEHPAQEKADPWRHFCEGGTAQGQSIPNTQTGASGFC